MAHKKQRSSGPRCLECNEVVVDFEYFTPDRKRKGLICEACGPGRPKMVTPKSKQNASVKG